jgi:hypothetical protein
MADTTILGTSLSFADLLRPVEGFQVVDKFGIQVPSGYAKAPSPSHIAMTTLLPVCNDAVAANSSGYFDGLLLLSLMFQETLPKFNPRSNCGSGKLVARGIGQFIYETGKRGVKPPIIDFYNPADSIYACAYYLRTCYETYKRRSPTLPANQLLAYAVMGYNSGPGRTITEHDQGIYNRVGNVLTKVSTKDYAKKINANYGGFSGTGIGPLIIKK